MANAGFIDTGDIDVSRLILVVKEIETGQFHTDSIPELIKRDQNADALKRKPRLEEFRVLGIFDTLEKAESFVANFGSVLD